MTRVSRDTGRILWLSSKLRLEALGIDVFTTRATFLMELVSAIEDPDRIEIKS
jgi:hypothetical protein